MDTQTTPSSPLNKKFLDLYREAPRPKHYAHPTEDTYLAWVSLLLIHSCNGRLVLVV